MNAAWAAIILLAVVQGATEFLPISSSGHLSLGHALLQTDDPGVLTDIVLHAGTLLAVMMVYRRELLTIITDCGVALRRLPGQGWRAVLNEPGAALALYVLLGSMVTAVIGFTAADFIETRMRSPLSVGAMLLVNGTILWASRKSSQADTPPEGELSYGISAWRAMLIGLLQGIAIIPGVSRSGLTISGALRLGVPGPVAARFSFLLSIPAILGALLLKMRAVESTTSIDWTRLFSGALIAAVVGWVCLVLLLKLLERARFHHFAWYCWAIGAVAIATSLLNS